MRKLTLSVFLILTACSSNPTINGKRFEKDEILSTLGDKSMPDWASDGETKPLRFVDDKVYSVGVTQLQGDERPEAGARVATNNSFSNISSYVESRTEFILQNSEEGFGYDSTTSKFIGSQVSSITSHEFTNEGVWWKRYVQYDGSDTPHIYYKVYSLVTLPMASLKSAVYAAIHKGVEQHKLSESFQTQVSHQWDRFVDGKQETAQPIQVSQEGH